VRYHFHTAHGKVCVGGSNGISQATKGLRASEHKQNSEIPSHLDLHRHRC